MSWSVSTFESTAPHEIDTSSPSDGGAAATSSGGGVPVGMVVGMAAGGDLPAGVGGLAGAAGDGTPESASPLVHVAAGPTDLAGCLAAGLIAKRLAVVRLMTQSRWVEAQITLESAVRAAQLRTPRRPSRL